jgi:hypothetical protein
VHPFCSLQGWARTHTVLVVGLYELLGNPTTKLIEPLQESELNVSFFDFSIVFWYCSDSVVFLFFIGVIVVVIVW